jgi:hypothetical protein
LAYGRGALPVHDWTNEFLSWLAIYGSFIAACLIIVVIALGLHLVWRILPARWPLLILGLAGLIVWGGLGNPAETIAGWISPHSPAPWESVDAFYYPDKSNLGVSLENHDVGGLAQCRIWVSSAAVKQNDPQLELGDYECGVGYLHSQSSLKSFRLTVRRRSGEVRNKLTG